MERLVCLIEVLKTCNLRSRLIFSKCFYIIKHEVIYHFMNRRKLMFFSLVS